MWAPLGGGENCVLDWVVSAAGVGGVVLGAHCGLLSDMSGFLFGIPVYYSGPEELDLESSWAGMHCA